MLGLNCLKALPQAPLSNNIFRANLRMVKDWVDQTSHVFGLILVLERTGLRKPATSGWYRP
jgi:hypothetical protein